MGDKTNTYKQMKNKFNSFDGTEPYIEEPPEHSKKRDKQDGIDLSKLALNKWYHLSISYVNGKLVSISGLNSEVKIKKWQRNNEFFHESYKIRCKLK